MRRARKCLVEVEEEGKRSMSRQWRRKLRGTGARAPSSFGNSVHSAAAASLTVKNLENYQRKTCITFSSILPETR